MVDCEGNRIHISAESAITDPSSRLLQRPEAQRVSQQKAFREGTANISPKTVEPDPVYQPATELPSIRNPNAGQRTSVAMPSEFSATAARPDAAATFNMADGSTVKIGPASPKADALKSDSRARLDYLIERADEIKFGMLRGGDIAGATALRDFVQSEEASKLAKETWQSMKREGSSSPRLDSLMERADDFILERVMAGDIEGAMVFRAFVQDRLSEHQRIILIPAKNEAYNTMFDYVCSNVR